MRTGIPIERKKASCAAMPASAASLSSVASDAPDVSGKAGKARNIGIEDIARPARPDRGEALAVVDVKFLAQRVAELMRGKVLLAAKAGQAVVREEPAHMISLMAVSSCGSCTAAGPLRRTTRSSASASSSVRSLSVTGLK